METEDVFYMTREDKNKYLYGARFPGGSALVFVGDFEISEDQELKVNEMKLIFCQEPGFTTYISSVSCIYNIKSFYEKQKELKRRQEEAEKLAILEEERKQKLLEAARQKIEAEAEKHRKIEEAKQKIAENSTPIDEKLQAIAFLEQV